MPEPYKIPLESEWQVLSSTFIPTFSSRICTLKTWSSIQVSSVILLCSPTSLSRPISTSSNLNRRETDSVGPYGSLASSGPHTQAFLPSQEWPISAAFHRSLWMCSRLLSIAACTMMKLEWTNERIWSRILPFLVQVFPQNSGASFKVSGAVMFVDAELNCVAFK